MPIKFSKKDCLTKIETGNLVYFELNNGPLNIERASLANFDIEFVRQILNIRDKDYESTYEERKEIRFEDISDLPASAEKYIRTEEDNVFMENSNNKDLSDEDIDNLIKNFEFEKHGILKLAEEPKSCFDLDWEEEKRITLPNDIDSLYKLFGCQYHTEYPYFDDDYSEEKEAITINLTDIGMWVDRSVLQHSKYYGKNVEDFSQLYDIFIAQQQKASKKFRIRNKENFSPAWGLILNKMREEDLQKIFEDFPHLQPLFPERYCLANLDKLSPKYYFCTKKVIREYLNKRISSVSNTLDFCELEEILNGEFRSVNNGVGVSIEVIKRDISKLKLKLIEYYNTKVLPALRKDLKCLTDSRIRILSLNSEKEVNTTSLRTIKLGKYIDWHNKLSDDDDLEECVFRYKESFDSIDDKDKKCLHDIVVKDSNKCLLKILDKDSNNIKAIEAIFDELGSYIDNSLINEVRKKGREYFCTIKDDEILQNLYDNNLISEKDFSESLNEAYKNLDISVCSKKLKYGVSYTKNNLPNDTKLFLLNRIFELAGYNSLLTRKTIRLDDIDIIYSLESLLDWAKKLLTYHDLDPNVYYTVTKEFVKDFKSEDKAKLYKEGYINELDKKYIQNKLNEIYPGKQSIDFYKLINYNPFKKDETTKFLGINFTQEVMFDDLKSKKDLNTLLFILAKLNNYYKDKIRNGKNKELKFYLWSLYPEENVDWESISAYYSLLPEELQIRVLRYLFSLKAKGSLSFTISELIKNLNGDLKKIPCTTVNIMLFILKEKSEGAKTVVQAKELEHFFSLTFKEIANSVNVNILDFFYLCGGRELIYSQPEDTDYYERNGKIEKKEKNGKEFYVISFYENPLDIYGNEVEHLFGDIQDVIDELILNIPCIQVGDDFWISTDLRAEIADFVRSNNIDDKCNLFTPAIKTIYTGRWHNSVISNDEIYDHYLCKCNRKDIDPINHMPFVWCDGKPCTHRGWRFECPANWENYKFIDFLNILLGCNPENAEPIFDINSEISRFILKLFSDEENEQTVSELYNAKKDLGKWTEGMSIMTNISDDYNNDDTGKEDEYEDDDYNDSLSEEPPTYDRYNGSYAQDKMGYSDDDIDTIFDGDPDAYWNID